MEAYITHFNVINRIRDYIRKMPALDYSSMSAYSDVDNQGLRLFQEYSDLPSIFCDDDDSDDERKDNLMFLCQRELSRLYFHFLTDPTIPESQLVIWFSMCMEKLSVAILNRVGSMRQHCQWLIDMMMECVRDGDYTSLDLHIEEFRLRINDDDRLKEECHVIIEDMKQVCIAVYYLSVDGILSRRIVEECVDELHTSLVRQYLILVRHQYTNHFTPPTIRAPTTEEELLLDIQYPDLEWDQVSFPYFEQSPTTFFDSDDNSDELAELNSFEEDVDSIIALELAQIRLDENISRHLRMLSATAKKNLNLFFPLVIAKAA